MSSTPSWPSRWPSVWPAPAPPPTRPGPGDVGVADPARLGLFVAGRLAARHGVHVALGTSPYLGTKAEVGLPDAIVVSETAEQDVYGERQRGDSALLNLRAPHVLSLSDPFQQDPGAAGGGGPDEAQAAGPAPGALHGLPQRVRPDAQPGDDGA